MYEKYVWLFPIIFIFHDMEEIIGFGLWLKKNRKLLKEKYPWVLDTYWNFSTEGFSLAVFEELILCITFSALALLLNINVLWYFWLGCFIACTLHFVIHIGQSIIMKQYIPATITSVICLPISIWIIAECISAMGNEWWLATVFVALGITVTAINLRLAQKMIGWFTKKAKL